MRNSHFPRPAETDPYGDIGEGGHHQTCIKHHQTPQDIFQTPQDIFQTTQNMLLTRAVEVPKKKAGKKAPATGAAGAF